MIGTLADMSIRLIDSLKETVMFVIYGASHDTGHHNWTPRSYLNTAIINLTERTCNTFVSKKFNNT